MKRLTNRYLIILLIVACIIILLLFLGVKYFNGVNNEEGNKKYNSSYGNSYNNSIEETGKINTSELAVGSFVKDCKDYDGARNYFTASKVIADSKEFDDSCLDEKKVLEYYCQWNENSTQIQSQEYNCPYKCMKNACLE